MKTASRLIRRRLRVTVWVAVAAIAIGAATLAGPTAANASSNSASVSGAVFGAGSPKVPIKGALVELLQGEGGPTNILVTTDSAGRYTLNGVFPGTYSIRFTSSTTQNFAPQWWNGSNGATSPKTFAVKDGQALTGYNVLLPKGATISGYVTDEVTKKALAGIQIDAVPADNEFTYSGSATTDATGKYVVSRLLPGSYKLNYARAVGLAFEWWDASPDFTGAKAVTVAAGGSVKNISPTLVAGASVAGNVRDAAGKALEGVAVTVLIASGSYASSAQTDAQGNFTVDDLYPGKYIFSFVDRSTGTERTEYWSNTFTKESASALPLTSGKKFTGMNVVFGDRKLTAPYPTITGTPTVGSKLTAVSGTWGPAPVTLTYSWLRNGTVIPGATAKTYFLTAGDRGKTIATRVVGKKFDYVTIGKTSAVTKPIQ